MYGWLFSKVPNEIWMNIIKTNEKWLSVDIIHIWSIYLTSKQCEIPIWPQNVFESLFLTLIPQSRFYNCKPFLHISFHLFKFFLLLPTSTPRSYSSSHTLAIFFSLRKKVRKKDGIEKVPKQRWKREKKLQNKKRNA